jgi:hypothetical protein
MFVLMRFDPVLRSVFFIWRTGDSITGAEVDGSSYTVYGNEDIIRYSVQTNRWDKVLPDGLQAASLTWEDCMFNCIEEKLPGYIIKKQIKTISQVSKGVACIAASSGQAEDLVKCSKIIAKGIPGYSEGVDLGLCNSDCKACEASGQGCANDKCHCCVADKIRCDSDDFPYGIYDIDVIKRKECRDGMYLAEVTERICAICEKCIVGGSGAACVAQTALAAAGWLTPLPLNEGVQGAENELALISGPTVSECDECRQAKDPNEIVGPEGDLLPGQLVTYTIFFENVGEGEAFDVFIVNELGENLDLATLQLPDHAVVAAGARTIYFTVGNLAPKDQPGAKGSVTYSVRVKAGLPSGTVVTNQAVVHFPSVPEETPTNVVANTVEPLVAYPQTLEAVAGQPINIQLAGRDVSDTPLTFAIMDEPIYGTLSGAAPALVYTPAENFAGLDRLIFTVSNGTATSRQAEVSILVQPRPNDTTAPFVFWTSPEDDAQPVDSELLAGGSDPRYAPLIQIQFSEAMAPDSFTDAVVQVTGPDSQTIAVDVNYDATTYQASILLNAAPNGDTTYTVTLKRSVTDLSGNALAGDVSWPIRIGSGPTTQTGILFLPVVEK